MARNRDDRYPNAAEFQLDLQRLRGYGREYTHTPGGTRRPVVELPSDDLDAHSSSVDIPIAVRRSPAPPGAARTRGFEDLPTEIDHLKDFSMSDDEDDAATALMPRDEIRKIESLAEPPPPFEPFDSDVTTRTDHPILRNLPRAPTDSRGGSGPVLPARAPKRGRSRGEREKNAYEEEHGQEASACEAGER